MALILDADVQQMLACPKCGAEVGLSGEALVCRPCGLHFPVRDGIPIMLIESATDGRGASGYAAHAETDTESIAFYDTFYKGFNDYRRYARADVDFVRKLFRRLELRPESKILDLGSGTGYFHSLIEQMTGHKVVSADFSFEGFRAAREHYGLNNLVVMDAYESAFRAESLDVVLAIGLTPFKKSEHADIVDLVSRVARPIRAGGYFVFVWSTNLSGKVQDASVTTTDGKARTSRYYNHTRQGIGRAFGDSGCFSAVEDFAFIRPLSRLYGPLTMSRANTLLTEVLMKVTPRSLSARLVVIGRKS